MKIIKKVTIREKEIKKSYHDRLVASKAISLINNHIIIDLGNGYSKIIPIDPTKKVI